MKRILFIAMILPIVTFAQEESATKVEAKKERTLSLFTNASQPAQLGISFEEQFEPSENGYNSSSIFQLSIGTMTVDNFDTFTGIGFIADSGFRAYLKKASWSGFYAENFFTYGRIKFDTPMIIGLQDQFIGTYTYMSLINPNLGYKINLGKFSIDPSIGFNWKWEFKGKGDFQNSLADNFVPRIGVKAGYRF